MGEELTREQLIAEIETLKSAMIEIITITEDKAETPADALNFISAVAGCALGRDAPGVNPSLRKYG